MTKSSDASDPSSLGPPSGDPAAGAPLRLDGAFPRRDADDWRAAAEASLRGGATLDSLARRTLDDLTIEVLYDGSPVAGRVTPSATPRTRGPDGDATPAWDNRLHVLGDTPEALSGHALAGLAGGVTSLELDLRGASLDALPTALDGVHLDMITLSLRVGDAADAAVDAWLGLLDARGQDPGASRLELDADPLGELARGAVPPGGIDAARERLARVAVRAARELPHARVVGVDTVVHHAAGASPARELVAGIAAATSHLDALLDAGLDADAALRGLVFRVALDADLVGGVVKLRALERLWRHALAGANLPVVRPYVVAETSRRHLSRLAPWVNHLRNVSAATAAAIGGADVIVVHPHDLVDGRRIDSGLSGDDPRVADRVARNLPVLLAEEAGMLAVDDAAGGAHAIESLTQALVETAWSSLGALDERGGLAAALASGEWRADIARTHAARVARLAAGESVRVGVNRFRHDGASVAATSASETSGGEPGGEDGQRPAATLEPVRDAWRFESAGGGASATPSPAATGART